MTNASADTNQSLEVPLNDRFYTSLILDLKKSLSLGEEMKKQI